MALSRAGTTRVLGEVPLAAYLSFGACGVPRISDLRTHLLGCDRRTILHIPYLRLGFGRLFSRPVHDGPRQRILPEHARPAEQPGWEPLRGPLRSRALPPGSALLARPLARDPAGRPELRPRFGGPHPLPLGPLEIAIGPCRGSICSRLPPQPCPPRRQLVRLPPRGVPCPIRLRSDVRLGTTLVAMVLVGHRGLALHARDVRGRAARPGPLLGPGWIPSTGRQVLASSRAHEACGPRLRRRDGMDLGRHPGDLRLQSGPRGRAPLDLATARRLVHLSVARAARPQSTGRPEWARLGVALQTPVLVPDIRPGALPPLPTSPHGPHAGSLDGPRPDRDPEVVLHDR